MANVPAELKYTNSHEWVRLEDGIATIGITDFAQSELGDVVYVDLPNVGRSLTTGDTFGSVESVKTVSDIYAPVSGEVVDTNAALGAQSELINSDPYGKGYILKIKLDGDLPGDLLDADAYTALIS
jgi:glycine cleavage system H protein